MRSCVPTLILVVVTLALTTPTWGMNNYTVISFWGDSSCSGSSGPLQKTYTLYPGACSSMPHECIPSGSNGVYESIGCEAASLNPQQAAPGTAQSIMFSGGSCDSAADISEATIWPANSCGPGITPGSASFKVSCNATEFLTLLYTQPGCGGTPYGGSSWKVGQCLSGSLFNSCSP